MSHETIGTIFFFICSTSAILAQKDGEEGAGTEGRRNNCGKIKTYSYEFVFICSGKFLIREKSDCILRSGETHGCGDTGKQDEKKFETWQAPSSQVKLKEVYLGGLMGESAGKPVATEENQEVWEFSESDSWSIHEDEVTGKLAAYTKGAVKPAAFCISENLGNPQAERRKWPHNFFHILGSRVLYGQSLFDCEKDLRSRTHGRNGGPQRERGYLVNVYEYHSSSSSSSMIRIYDSSRIMSRVLWRSYSKKLKNWSRTRQTSMVYQWLITKTTQGARQACCVTKSISSGMPRPTFSPTQCSVWEV